MAFYSPTSFPVAFDLLPLVYEAALLLPPPLFLLSLVRRLMVTFFSRVSVFSPYRRLPSQPSI